VPGGGRGGGGGGGGGRTDVERAPPLPPACSQGVKLQFERKMQIVSEGDEVMEIDPESLARPSFIGALLGRVASTKLLPVEEPAAAAAGAR